eukprot:1161411-Pelagomonas_calceolata.AAC.7
MQPKCGVHACAMYGAHSPACAGSLACARMQPRVVCALMLCMVRECSSSVRSCHVWCAQPCMCKDAAKSGVCTYAVYGARMQLKCSLCAHAMYGAHSLECARRQPGYAVCSSHVWCSHPAYSPLQRGGKEA